jgi:hypothetical protein
MEVHQSPVHVVAIARIVSSSPGKMCISAIAVMLGRCCRDLYVLFALLINYAQLANWCVKHETLLVLTVKNALKVIIYNQMEYVTLVTLINHQMLV